MRFVLVFARLNFAIYGKTQIDSSALSGVVFVGGSYGCSLGGVPPLSALFQKRVACCSGRLLAAEAIKG
jgi:hypothetical protein